MMLSVAATMMLCGVLGDELGSSSFVVLPITLVSSFGHVAIVAFSSDLQRVAWLTQISACNEKNVVILSATL